MTHIHSVSSPRSLAESCLLCSKPLGALKRILYGSFCCQAHQQEHEKQQADRTVRQRTEGYRVIPKTVNLAKPGGPDWEQRLEAARRAARQAQFREDAVRSAQSC